MLVENNLTALETKLVNFLFTPIVLMKLSRRFNLFLARSKLSYGSLEVLSYTYLRTRCCGEQLYNPGNFL